MLATLRYHETAESSITDMISLLQKKKKKCHVVNVPLLSTKGSVQSKPFRVVQNVLKKQLFFGVLVCKKAITYALFLQE